MQIVGLGEELAEGKGENIMGQELVGYENDNESMDGEPEVRAPVRKKRRIGGNLQNLLDAVIERQQRFFSDLLESMERKEQIREQIRQEREDKWRAEERAQLGLFNKALVALTRELVGEGVVSGLYNGVSGLSLGATPNNISNNHQRSRSRFKNWKRAEVVQLIRLRGEMDSRFAMAATGLWDEVGDRLTAQGFRRDGQQCRAKWEKLMALYNDVAEGKRGRDEIRYFHELTNALRRPGTEQ